MVPNVDMSVLLESISVGLMSKFVVSVLVIILLAILKNIIHNIIKKQVKSNRNIYKWQRLSTNIMYGFGITIIGLLWLSGITSFTAFLGILTAGIAFALRDMVADFAGYLFVLFRQPFSIGDRIEINGIRGDVLHFDWFQFTLLEIGNWVESDQSTGRVMYIPISKVLTESIGNYSTGFDWIWNEINVLVTFESDWEKARRLTLEKIKEVTDSLNEGLEKAMKKAAQLHLIEYSNTEPIVYMKAVDSGIEFTARYLCPTKKRRDSENEFWEKMVALFSEEQDLHFAYPTEKHFLSNTP